MTDIAAILVLRSELFVLCLIDKLSPILSNMFRVSWAFCSGEVPNAFSRWRRLRPCWISDGNEFSYLRVYKSHRYFLSSYESISLSVQEKKFKINFQNGGYGGHLRFLIGIMLASFDLDGTPILTTKF